MHIKAELAHIIGFNHEIRCCPVLSLLASLYVASSVASPANHSSTDKAKEDLKLTIEKMKEVSNKYAVLIGNSNFLNSRLNLMIESLANIKEYGQVVEIAKDEAVECSSSGKFSASCADRATRNLKRISESVLLDTKTLEGLSSTLSVSNIGFGGHDQGQYGFMGHGQGVPGFMGRVQNGGFWKKFTP